MHLNKKIALFLAALTLLISSSVAVFAQDLVNAQAYRTVNVRSGPSTLYPVMGQLVGDTTVEVTGRSDGENNWLRIDFEGQTGWVAYFVISVTGTLEDIPTAEAATIEPEATESLEVFQAEALAAPSTTLTTRFNSNLRAEPSFRAAVLVVIPFDTTLEIEARTAENNWLRVTYEGQTGWLLASLASIDPDVDLDSLPVDPTV